MTLSSKDIAQLRVVVRSGAVVLTWLKSSPVYEGHRSASGEFSIYRKAVPGFTFGLDGPE